MTGPVLLARTDGRVRHLTFNRPDALNALNRDVLAALEDELTAAARDETIGAVLIDGTGERAFCAGADLTELDGLDAAGAHHLLLRGQRIVAAIEELPVPVVAAVDGYALGGGFEIALACPIVLASDRSRFGLPEARLGLMPGYGGTQRLRRAVGHAPAMALLLTGAPVDAARAWHLGLLSAPPEPPDGLARTAADLAGELAQLSRPTLGLILESARSPSEGVEGLRHEAALAALAIASGDGQEGIRSFREKRPPLFHRPG
ncbi:MAG: enoyl-CoA hydratase [Pseudonocardiales bacterium]|nr:enoyl-CoA hydratase [Pseudonocardiales bacterium]